MSPPVMRAAVTVPCSAMVVRKCTRSVRWSAVAISTKSMPFSVVFCGASSSSRRFFCAISGDHDGEIAIRLGLEQHIADLDDERALVEGAVRRHDLHALDLDLAGEPVAERPLDEELRRRVERGRAWGEEELAHAAAELGQVGALAGRREEHLPDHLSHVLVVARARGLARAGVDPERKRVVASLHDATGPYPGAG